MMYPEPWKNVVAIVALAIMVGGFSIFILALKSIVRAGVMRGRRPDPFRGAVTISRFENGRWVHFDRRPEGKEGPTP